MKRRMKFSMIGVVCLSLGLAACGQDDEAKKPDNNAGEETVATQASIEQGEKVAKTSCITCHGADLTGDMGPNLHNLSLTKEEIIDVLVKGGKAMPPATAKGHEEDVAAYLLTLK